MIENTEYADALEDCFQRHNLSAEDRAAIMEWADDGYTRHCILENIRTGAMDVVSIKDGEPAFKLTPHGIQQVERMKKK